MRAILMTVTLIAVLAGSAAAQRAGTFTDKRDKKAYGTVKIGKQTWMAENLRHPTKGPGSWCIGDSLSDCGEKYGLLYNWNSAKTICPSGWRLPDTADWNKLINTVGGQEVAGKKLKTKKGWNDYNGRSGNGTNDFGFSALPGGLSNGHNDFNNSKPNDAGDFGYWWTATDNGGGYAYYKRIGHNKDNVGEALYDYSDKKSGGFSVRCVKK
jgi:uncharacterized protein (TIGR02145 family)